MSCYFPGGPVAKTMLPLKGVQVRSLVEEYASWCGKKKNVLLGIQVSPNPAPPSR